MVTGVRPDSFKNLELNSGVFLKNFSYAEYADKDALEEAILSVLTGGVETGAVALGATSGGGSFQCTPTIRQIELDGMRAPIIGSTVNDMWTVKLTTTLKEITPQNMADALICADVTTAGKLTTVRVRNAIEAGDYIENICWVGDLSDGRLVLIEIANALNLTGANFTFTDKGEGSLPVEFQAHQADLSNNQYAPCTIVYFDLPDEGT